MDDMELRRGRDAITWARRGSNEDRAEGARQMRELADDMRDRRVADDLRSTADQIDEYSRMVAERSDQPGEGDRLEQAYDDMTNTLIAVQGHFI